jgi:hypothetical protein
MEYGAYADGHMDIVEKMVELGGKFEEEEDADEYKKWKKIRKHILKSLWIL